MICSVGAECEEHYVHLIAARDRGSVRKNQKEGEVGESKKCINYLIVCSRPAPFMMAHYMYVYMVYD